MRLNQMTAPAVDLEQSIAFYKLLGFRQIVSAPAYARFEVPDGEATFSLHVVEKASRGDGISLYLEVDNVDATVRRLLALGIVFEDTPKDQRWLWREAWFRDPCNNRLCIYHAGENRRNPPWRID